MIRVCLLLLAVESALLFRAVAEPCGSTRPPVPMFPTSASVDPAGDLSSLTFDAPLSGSSPFPNLVSVAEDVAFADLDGNGIPDLLTVGAFDDALAVLMNPADTSQSPAPSPIVYPVGLNDGPLNDLPRAMTVADFDSDGRPDVAVVSSGTYHPLAPPDHKRSSVTVYLGRPGGLLALSQVLTIPNPSDGLAFSSSILSADLDGDGVLDLVAGNRMGNAIQPFRGDGFGRFAALPEAALPGADEGPRAVAFLSVTNGIRVLAATESHLVALRPLAPASGSWSVETVAAVYPEAGGELSSLAVGDFDGDGLHDVAVGDVAGGIQILDGWDGVAPPTTARRLYPAGLGEVVSLGAGDWSGIGRDQLAVADYSGGIASIYDPETESMGIQFQIGTHPRTARMIDWRHRGLPDLVVANEDDTPPSSDVAVGENPGTPPNDLGIQLPSPSGRPAVPIVVGNIQGMTEGPSSNHYYVVDPNHGTILHLQSNASGTIARTPNVLDVLDVRSKGCAYPTDVARTKTDFAVACSGSATISRFLPNGNFKGTTVVPSGQFDPGASGFWGIAYSKTRDSLFLSAPDKQAVVEIDDSGSVLRVIDTAPWPFLDLDCDDSHNALLGVHPGRAVIRILDLTSPTFAADDFDLAPYGMSGIAAVANITTKSTDPSRYAVMSGGHLWQITATATPLFTPAHLFLEGGAPFVSADDQDGLVSVFFTVPRPLPAVVMFPPDSLEKGELHPLKSLPGAGAIPSDFDPGPIAAGPGQVLFIADRRTSVVVSLDWATSWVIAVSHVGVAVEESDPTCRENVGIWHDDLSDVWTVVYPCAVLKSQGSGAGAISNLVRLSRSHRVDSASAASDGSLFLFNTAEARVMTTTPEGEPSGLTSLFPFLEGSVPCALAWSEDSNELLVTVAGEIEPIVLAAQPSETPTPTPPPTPTSTPLPSPTAEPPTGATGSWRSYR